MLELYPEWEMKAQLYSIGGVRVEYTFEGIEFLGWVCLADVQCRNGTKFINLSCGKFVYALNL